MLAQKPQSGYDLRKVFVETPMNHYSDSPGSIYPALKRLKARRWTGAVRDAESAHNREIFHITPAGTKALADWLQEPFGRTEIIRNLNDLLLRFALFDGNLDRKAALRFLARFEQELAGQVRDLERFMASSGMAGSASTGALAFANGIESYRGHLQWARRARERLSKSPIERPLRSC